TWSTGTPSPSATAPPRPASDRRRPAFARPVAARRRLPNAALARRDGGSARLQPQPAVSRLTRPEEPLYLPGPIATVGGISAQESKRGLPMKAHCRSAHWLGAVLLGLSGCWTTSSQLKPQRPPEEYVLPPADDRRFSDYPSFPKGTMNNDRIK